jgi:hypothetical protein
MSFLDCMDARRIGWVGANFVLQGACLIGTATPTRAGDNPSSARAVSVPNSNLRRGSIASPRPWAKDPHVRLAALDNGSATAVSQVKLNGTPVPGSRITIGVDGAQDARASYHWVQIDGPPVTITDETKPRIEVTVPPGAESLSFLLTIMDERGQTTTRLSIPIEQMGPNRVARTALRADAGDDQIGLVGRRITLNGSRSAPRTGLVYRWVQLSGPKIEHVLQENAYCSFTPQVSGIYRLGLIVASPGSDSHGGIGISELDEVTVTVGEVPSGAPTSSLSGTSGGYWTSGLDQMLQGPGASSARATLEQAAAVFEAIALRTSLYTNFGELTSEMTRRLDGIVPTDPSWRQFWTHSVFGPMSQHTALEMLGVGIDLRTPLGQNQGLNALQQDKLQKLFSSYAREFRSRTQPR